MASMQKSLARKTPEWPYLHLYQVFQPGRFWQFVDNLEKNFLRQQT